MLWNQLKCWHLWKIEGNQLATLRTQQESSHLRTDPDENNISKSNGAEWQYAHTKPRQKHCNSGQMPFEVHATTPQCNRDGIFRRSYFPRFTPVPQFFGRKVWKGKHWVALTHCFCMLESMFAYIMNKPVVTVSWTGFPTYIWWCEFIKAIAYIAGALPRLYRQMFGRHPFQLFLI